MTPTDPSSTMIRSDKNYRIMVMTLLVGLVVFGTVLILFTNTYIQELQQVAQQAPEQVPMNTGLLLLGITMLAGLPAVGIGTYMAYLGNQIRATCHIPPPGTRVVVDTQVIKGTSAKVRGTVLIVLGSLMILCGLGLPIVAWSLIPTF